MLFTAEGRPHTSAVTYIDVFQAEMIGIACYPVATTVIVFYVSNAWMRYRNYHIDAETTEEMREAVGAVPGFEAVSAVSRLTGTLQGEGDEPEALAKSAASSAKSAATSASKAFTGKLLRLKSK